MLAVEFVEEVNALRAVGKTNTAVPQARDRGYNPTSLSRGAFVVAAPLRWGVLAALPPPTSPHDLTKRAKCHTEYGMKMTMHIDAELLDRVIAAHGFASKTEAVEMALKEMDRKDRLKEYFKNGLGWTKEELKNAVDPNYDLMALRAAEIPSKYAKRRSR